MMKSQASECAPSVLDTGIAREDMYRMSREFCDQVYDMGLSPNALRLTHALSHATCQEIGFWWQDAIQPPDAFRRPCLSLRRVLGTEKANGNRDITTAIAELQDIGVFDTLGFEHDNAWLVWRLDDDALRLMLDEHRYGLFDASHLSRLRTHTDLFLHARMALVQRMSRACFNVALTNRPWSVLSRTVLTSLRRGAGLHGLLLIVSLEARGTFRGIDAMQVRAWRRGSIWKISDLAKLSAVTRRCLLIDGAGHIEVKPDALEDSLRRVHGAGWSLAALR